MMVRFGKTAGRLLPLLLSALLLCGCDALRVDYDAEEVYTQSAEFEAPEEAVALSSGAAFPGDADAFEAEDLFADAAAEDAGLRDFAAEDDADSFSPDEDAFDDASPDEDLSEDAEEDAAEEEPAEDFELGMRTGTGYSYPFAGFNFLPRGHWNYYSRTQLNSVNGAEQQTDAAVETAAVQKSVDDGLTYVMMFAEDDARNSNISIAIDNASVFYGEDTIEEKLPDLAQAVRGALQANGFSGVQTDTAPVHFLGSQYPAVSASGTGNAENIYMTQLYVRHGSYVISITVTTFGENHTADVLSQMQAEGTTNL